MKTYSPKLTDIKHEWYIVDVKGKTLGKVATKIVNLLRGKGKPTYSPHLDCGDFVVVINAADIKLTGNNMDTKEYNYHTRYPGGLKTTTPRKLIAASKPERIIENAVAGMIPHNKLKKDILKKLKVYAGAEHEQSAQQPKPYEL
jgi:large subunit ribosomal protein L13